MSTALDRGLIDVVVAELEKRAGRRLTPEGIAWLEGEALPDAISGAYWSLLDRDAFEN